MSTRIFGLFWFWVIATSHLLLAVDIPDGHPAPSLTVFNGTGGGVYSPGQSVSITATPPEGYTFVKWHKTDVHGWIQEQHSPSTTFIMPPTPVRLVAISAKIESWFPIIEDNEEIDTWLLLPRPANETDRKRFPHRVRVSINTGDTQDFDMVDALNNMSIQLGWFPTQQGEGIWHSNDLVKYWDTENTGTTIPRDTSLPTRLFEETSHGVFEATVWFAGDWLPKTQPPADNYVPPEALTGFKLLTISPNFRRTVASTSNKLVPISLAVDANRDGEIKPMTPADATSEDSPFRFWSNDDDDNGDLANNDVPGQAPNQATGGFVPPGADYWTGFTGWGEVDGRTDLADFFPVFLDIKQLLNVLPPSPVVPGQTQSIVYKLKHADGALNFVYTNVTRAEAFDYLRHSDERVAYGYPGLPEVAAHEARTERITADGTPLHTTFLDRIKNEIEKGVILIEGRQPTTAPLRLVVEKDGVEIAEVALHLKISPVEDMYRWINLRGVCGQSETRPTNIINQPPAYPDALTNGKMFIFVHGYNVNEEQSRGWNAEAFKRMWHSGSKAMFTAVSWHGDYSQRPLPFIGLVAPDYWDNIPNAFLTAQALAPLVNALPGSSKVIAGHSMGNIVASSAIKDHGMNVAKYLMVDAAVALEAYDTSVSTTGPYYVNAMRPYPWIDYDRRLWSTDWWQLFPEGDNRRRLTWMNRFGNISNALNIYSSGEEVLNNNDLTPGELPYALLPLGTERTWIQQEMSKGGGSAAGTLTGVVAGEIQGGWGFNEAWGSQVWTPDPFGGGSYTYVPPSVADANALTEAQIRTQPFFTRFNKASLMSADVGAGSSGSNAADETTRADLLGGAIPALSFPAGRNPVPLFNSTSRNQNLMELQDGWPAGRPNTRWLHSDIRDVAYFFNYGAWDFFTTEGNLR